MKRGLRWITTRLRAGFLLLRNLDRVDLFILGGLAMIYVGFHRDDAPLALIGGLVVLIGIQGAQRAAPTTEGG